MQTHMELTEFENVLQGMKEFKATIETQSRIRSISFENRILLTIHYIAKNTKLSDLMSVYGMNDHAISVTINETLPYLLEFFVREIPHQVNSSEHSSLSKSIIAILDNTCHRVPGRSSVLQNQDYGYKKFISTALVVDYDQMICAVSTNIPGKILLLQERIRILKELWVQTLH